MQVRLITTITTIVELTHASSFEEARAEIFNTYGDALDTDANQEQCIEAVQELQSGSVCFDSVVGTEVKHSFEEVK